ncbi:hypothetical protein G6L37_00585 [Agrobacterium rubi]|nr:hypothetical protein [Agrobacterium rubi]NTF23886.1 hypothetical protein [Agrobacterium rubi]
MSKPDIYTPNIDAFKQLRADSTTAWITDEGILHVVPLFGHLEFFVSRKDVLAVVSDYLQPFVIADGALELSKPHMAAAMGMIYESGWGRIGTFGGDKLELDCAREHLTDLRRKAKAVARVLNRALVCHVIHPSQKQPRNASPPLARDAAWSSLVVGFVGWLSPRGDLFEVPPDAPFATFADDPDRLPEFAYALARAVDADRQKQSAEFCDAISNSDPDGHMPWHQFQERPYNPNEEDGRELTSSILCHGWGRLSVIETGKVILETSPEHAAKLRDAVAPFATKADRKIHIHETRFSSRQTT